MVFEKPTFEKILIFFLKLFILISNLSLYQNIIPLVPSNSLGYQLSFDVSFVQVCFVVKEIFTEMRLL